MARDRKPLYLAGRIVLAALILALLPLSVPTQSASACELFYWYGPHQNPTTSLYNWDAATQGDINWVILPPPDLTPKALGEGDRLIFPEWAVSKRATNDYGPNLYPNGLPVYDMTFQDPTGYVVDGYPIQLSNGITVSAVTGANTVDLDIKLTTPQTFQVAGASTLTISGALSNTAGMTLTKNGPGTLKLTSEQNTFTGTIKVASGTLFIGNHVTGSNLTFVSGGAGITLAAMITSPGDYSQAVISGPTSYVKLNNAALVLDGPIQPLGTQTYTLIENQAPSTVAVVGTFQGINEGDLIRSLGGQQYTISYKGGDGNDVVLTPVWDPMYLPIIVNS